MTGLFQKRYGNWQSLDRLFYKKRSAAVPVSQRLYFYRKTFLFWYTISYKKIEKSDYEWLQVTTNDCKWLRAPMSQNTGLLVAMSYNYWPRARIQVITSSYNFWLPYLWPYLTSECHSKNRYSALSLDNNCRGSFEDVSKICWS